MAVIRKVNGGYKVIKGDAYYKPGERIDPGTKVARQPTQQELAAEKIEAESQPEERIPSGTTTPSVDTTKQYYVEQEIEGQRVQFPVSPLFAKKVEQVNIQLAAQSSAGTMTAATGEKPIPFETVLGEKTWSEKIREQGTKLGSQGMMSTKGIAGAGAAIALGVVSIPVAIAESIAHPIKTAKGIGYAVTHPYEVGYAIGAQIETAPLFTTGQVIGIAATGKAIGTGIAKIKQITTKPKFVSIRYGEGVQFATDKQAITAQRSIATYQTKRWFGLGTKKHLVGSDMVTYSKAMQNKLWSDVSRISYSVDGGKVRQAASIGITKYQPSQYASYGITAYKPGKVYTTGTIGWKYAEAHGVDIWRSISATKYKGAPYSIALENLAEQVKIRYPTYTQTTFKVGGMGAGIGLKAPTTKPISIGIGKKAQASLTPTFKPITKIKPVVEKPKIIIKPVSATKIKPIAPGVIGRYGKAFELAIKIEESRKIIPFATKFGVGISSLSVIPGFSSKAIVGVGVGQRAGAALAYRTGQLTETEQIVIPRITTGTTTTIISEPFIPLVPKIRVPPPTPPPTIITPPFLFPSGGIGQRRYLGKKGKRPFKYQESLVASAYGIRGKMPKIKTGFGIRPIINL
jgi:hypothetical protein